MPEKKPSDDDKLWIAVAVACLVAVIAVPATLAILVWLGVRNRLGRRENYALLLVGAGAWSLNAVDYATDYFSWCWDLVRGDWSLVAVPATMLLATGCLFLGVLGVMAQTSLGAKLPKQLQTSGKAAPADPFDVVPTEEAKSKLSPPSPTSALVVSARDHSITQDVPAGQRFFPLGIGANGQHVGLSEKEVRTHGVILGATGSGKSETIKGLAGALLDLGWSGMLLDLKEDTAPGGLRDWCAEYASYHSIPYQELRLSDANPDFWFNSFAGMGPDEIRDMVLTLNEFDDQHWQAINKELLGQAVNLMVWAHKAAPSQFPEPTMYDLGKMLSAGNLNRSTKTRRAVVLSSVPGTTEEDFRVLSDPSPDHVKSSAGFGAKLTLIYDTQAGRTVLRPDPDGRRRQLDVTARGLLYVGLDSQGKADLTRVISSSVLQRMSVYSSQRTTGQVEDDPDARAPRFLIVDEANWVDRTIVQNLLSRARSAGIAMFLCTQGPKDWIDDRGDDWGKLTQNTNIAIIMRQGEPASAELCADYIGTRRRVSSSKTKRVTQGAFGQTSLTESSESEREVEEHLVPPETLRTMGVGEAVIKIGVPTRVQWARVSMRDPKASASL